MESIGYNLIYFMQGKLPWQGIDCENKEEKYRLIMECKLNTKLETLC